MLGGQITVASGCAFEFDSIKRGKDFGMPVARSLPVSDQEALDCADRRKAMSSLRPLGSDAAEDLVPESDSEDQLKSD